MLRDWTVSEKVKCISVYTERFFVRLIMKADDYGCYFANASLLKAHLFPLLLNEVREADISRWMAECQKAGLIVLYEFDNKSYLEINDFDQRLRAKNRKFPARQADDGHVSVIRPLEVEVEVEVEKKKIGAVAPSYKKFSEKEFYDDLAKYATVFPKQMLRQFFEYWKEPSASGIMRFQMEKTWDTKLRLGRWQRKDKNFIAGKMEDAGGPSPAELHAKEILGITE